MKTNGWILLVILSLHLLLLLLSCGVRNLDLATLISKKYRLRKVNTLFKVKLQMMSMQFAALLKRNFRFVLFSRNF